ncbi:hypothetical protein LCGC14_1850030 [marine sediment metagenome]|uniref:HNH nuclease domain-containing protein n=1 Tax=marine sediment metagenome TaxID=412755 RepID=A0A0F9GAW6_9ZZZZ
MTRPNCIAECPPLPQLRDAEIQHCPGYPGYAITENGNAWSCRPKPQTRKTLTWRRLKPYLGTDGYWYVGIRTKGTTKKKKIAVLIVTAFLGPKPIGCELCHNDGVRTNDKLTNLRWDTRSANRMDSVKHGTHPNAKLTDKDVMDVISLRPYLLQREIAELYGVSRSHIGVLLSLGGRMRRHVK